MNSKRETGIANMLDHFNDLIGFCKSFGAHYNPGNAAISIVNLEYLATQVSSSFDEVTAVKRTLDNAIIARQEEFDVLHQIATRAVNGLTSFSVSPGTLDDARTFKRRITGQKLKSSKKPAAASENPEQKPKTISNAQTGFINQVEHFGALIKLLRSEPAYTPNEPDLRPNTLSELHARLRNANTVAGEAFVAFKTASAHRDALLYNEEDGLVTKANLVKAYVKSVFRARSQEYKQISGLSFPRRKSVVTEALPEAQV